MGPRGTFGFGLARSLDFHTSLSIFTELCELLSRSVGTVFYPHHALSYSELSAGLEKGELGLAWTPPIPAIDLQDRGAVTLLVAPVRKGSTLYHSALITRLDGPITLQGLRGKRAGWVDRESAAGHLVPKMHLAAAGFSVADMFKQEMFLGSHIAVVDAVVSGRVDVGATFCKVDAGDNRVVHASWTDGEGKNARPVSVVAIVGPIPNDVIVASSKLPAEVQRRVLRWFLDPDSARAKQLLAELVRADACRTATTAHYEPLRKIMAAAAALGQSPWRTRSWPPPPPPR